MSNSNTWAVPSDVLANPYHGASGQPLCPACVGGRLHPYLVEISLSDHPSGWHGANYLTGWVAVCVGTQVGDPAFAEAAPACGFSMPMTPHRYSSHPLAF